ncbi:hypothetical protein FACS18945_3650 [Bacteroidia bacterium]|nr:hypothetical protein FACS18945_3650 [Bacteroidia bacterium]
MGHAVRRDGLTLLPPNMREHIADWALEELDFDIILHVLAGDAYFEQNKTDVQKLEQEVGAKVHDLFNTHPIFAKYPRLRTLARDAVFEAWWAMEKQRKK